MTLLRFLLVLILTDMLATEGGIPFADARWLVDGTLPGGA